MFSFLRKEKNITKENSSLKNIYHCCIQKTASQWLKKMFIHLTKEKQFTHFDLCTPGKNFINNVEDRRYMDQPFPENTIVSPFYISYDDFLNFPKPKNYRAFWVMRDPRDIWISQYFSIKYSHHLRTENMAKVRKKLQEIPFEKGFMWFIEKKYRLEEDHGYITTLNSWLKAKNNKNVLIVKYESLTGTDQFNSFKNLLTHCELDIPEKDLQKLLTIFSFKNLSKGREQGENDEKSHYRKGISGDWKNYFTDDMKQIFNDKIGDLIIKLGYEKNNYW